MDTLAYVSEVLIRHDICLHVSMKISIRKVLEKVKEYTLQN